MNKIVLSVFGLLLPAMLVFAQVFTASGNQSASAQERVTKAKGEVAPKGDDEILKCIVDKLSNSEKLKTQGLSASVSDGEATLTGQAQNAGSKGAATRIAQSCGARSVKNNITAPGIPKPKKSEEKKPEASMKN
jgi:osmotically-inducible protein OsmY